MRKTLKILALLLGFALWDALPAQTITIDPRPSVTINQYDTIYNVTATPRTKCVTPSVTTGLCPIAGTATNITWFTQQRTGLLLARSSATTSTASGRTVYVYGISPGTTDLIVQWDRSAGIAVRDTVRWTTIGPRTVRTELAFGFHRDSMTGQLVSTTVHKLGAKFCVYGLAWDKNGNRLTGRPVTGIRITDTTVAKFDPGGPYLCPDTTVDPARVQAP